MLGISEDITEWKNLQNEKKELQDQLQRYTRQLETQVKLLETRDVGLTDREKIVLSAFVANPYATDQVLSEMTKIKRSTITAIRNRLKSEEWYYSLIIPRLSLIGYDVVVCFYRSDLSMDNGKLAKSLDILKNDPNFVFVMDSACCTVAVAAYKNIEEMHNKMQDLSENDEVNYLLSHMKRARFMSPKLTLYDVDCSALLQNLFGIVFPRSAFVESKPIELSKNEMEVLYALVRFPEADNALLEKHTRLSKPTLIKIKRKLFEHGYIRKIVVPNLARMGVQFGNLFHEGLDTPDYASDRFSKLVEQNAHSCLSLYDVEQVFILSLFSEPKQAEHMAFKLKTLYQQLYHTLKSPTLLSFREPKVVNLDLSSLLKEALNLDVDY